MGGKGSICAGFDDVRLTGAVLGEEQSICAELVVERLICAALSICTGWDFGSTNLRKELIKMINLDHHGFPEIPALVEPKI